MNPIRIAAVALFAFVLCAIPQPGHAWGKKKKKEPAAEAPASMKAGIHHQCLQARADENYADAWIALGELDQVRGFHKEAAEKYRKAVALGADPVTAELDFTWIGDVIWIQTAHCPVPVPAAPEGGTLVSVADNMLPPAYPESLLDSTQAEGNATSRVWVGPDGKPTRIQILHASSSLPQVQRTRIINEEASDRMISRVQFALATIETLRVHQFGSEVAGKVWEQKFAYRPSDGMDPNLPGQGFNDSALPTRGPSPGGSSKPGQ